MFSLRRDHFASWLPPFIIASQVGLFNMITVYFYEFEVRLIREALIRNSNC